MKITKISYEFSQDNSGDTKEESSKKLVANHPEDHRFTLRIPKWLMEKVDNKRKERVGTISRNLWILEVINDSTK